MGKEDLDQYQYPKNKESLLSKPQKENLDNRIHNRVINFLRYNI